VSWTLTYSKNFYKILENANPAREKAYALSELLHEIRASRNPLEMGGAYLDGWAFRFMGNCILICKVDKKHKKLIVDDMVFCAENEMLADPFA